MTLRTWTHVFSTFIILWSFNLLSAQDQLTEQYEDHNEPCRHRNHLRTSLFIGHTYLNTDTKKGKELLVLPSIGIDLEYFFNHQIGIGLHNDIELLTFEVESEENVFVEREYPVLITLDAVWHHKSGLVFYGGPGIEFEKQQDYFVFRFGTELALELNEHWDLYPSVFYDFRQGAYNSLNIGFGVGRSF